MSHKSQTPGEPVKVRPDSPRLRVASSRFSLLHLFGLIAVLAIVAALLRHEPLRIVGLAAAGSLVSFAISPLTLWLLRALWHDLWLPWVERRFSDWLVWFHWQRSQALLGLAILAILWAAVENELTQQASIRASVIPPMMMGLSLAWAVVVHLRCRPC